jgi:hypothetical protein
MNLSKEAQAFIQMCQRDGNTIGIQPFFGVEYENVNNYKFTKAVLDEMLSSGKVKVISQNNKSVTLLGV